jgi:hypothetical protein
MGACGFGEGERRRTRCRGRLTTGVGDDEENKDEGNIKFNKAMHSNMNESYIYIKIYERPGKVENWFFITDCRASRILNQG